INLEEYAEKTYMPNDKTPWDMLNVGVKKDWLWREYQNALAAKVSIPCEEACSNCGVCQEFGVAPSLQSE
ncbi:MAG: hypothetical protein GX568_05695, partial [Candidatus Gastranaerophilales bacterium]|nr:hypothetical protein [Candidatus Gastranaerophilales bacterium]